MKRAMKQKMKESVQRRVTKTVLDKTVLSNAVKIAGTLRSVAILRARNTVAAPLDSMVRNRSSID